MTLLTARDITVHDGNTQLLQPISLTLKAGIPLVVLGETGSGKSLLAQAIMGTLSAGLHGRGQVTIAGQALDAARPATFRHLWGRDIAVLPQEPWLSLDPLMRARAQVAEGHRILRGVPRAEARQRASADLAELGLGDVDGRYPQELSGGMAQRVAIAAARAGGAQIVIADEPTKGLDAARRDSVADLLRSETARGGGLLVITHDLTLAARLGGQIMVVRHGEVIEVGDTADVLAAPAHVYTSGLIAADPAQWPDRAAPAAASTAVVAAKNLGLRRGGRLLFSDVNLAIAPGHILGLTGPSGCGKSSLGDALLGLLAPSAGQVIRATGLSTTAFQKLHQDPVAAFPPHRVLAQTLGDVAKRAGQTQDRIATVMDRFALRMELLTRRPADVSGGELQRLSILRLMLVKPQFIFADEPTSRLDPVTQKQVIDLLHQMARDEGTAILLVSHDPALIRNTSDSVLDWTALRALAA